MVTGKRYIKKLVEDGIVDGWDDPASGFHRSPAKKRIYTGIHPDVCRAVRRVTRASSVVDYAMLEYCIREDLKTEASAYDGSAGSDQTDHRQLSGRIRWKNSMLTTIWKTKPLASRQIPFGRELYIDREDFMEDPPKKYFRLFPGNEVRLMDAYFVKCVDYEKDENGNVTEVHCTYDPETKSGSGFTGQKSKGNHPLGSCQDCHSRQKCVSMRT